MPQPPRLTRRLLGVIAKRAPDAQLHRVADPRERRGRRCKLAPPQHALLAGMVCGARGLGEAEDLTEDMSLPARGLLRLHRRVPDTSLRDLSICPAAFRRLVADHGAMFRVVLYDSGATTASERSGETASEPKASPKEATPREPNSRANAALVIDAGKDYVFRVQAERPTILAGCQRLLGRKRASTSVTTIDIDGGRIVTRRVWLDDRIAGRHDFSGLSTAFRVRSQTEDKTTRKVTTEGRCHGASPGADLLTPGQWLELNRRRWSVETAAWARSDETTAWARSGETAVEHHRCESRRDATRRAHNHCHCTWDRIFREDDRPWVRQPEGMLNVMLLRRIAYDLLVRFRSVTQRSEHERAIPCKRLLARPHKAMLLATTTTIAGLRLLPEELATS